MSIRRTLAMMTQLMHSGDATLPHDPATLYDAIDPADAAYIYSHDAKIDRDPATLHDAVDPADSPMIPNDAHPPTFSSQLLRQSQPMATQ